MANGPNGPVETDVRGYYVAKPTYSPDVPFIMTNDLVIDRREVIPEPDQTAFLPDETQQVRVRVLKDAKTNAHYLKPIT